MGYGVGSRMTARRRSFVVIPLLLLGNAGFAATPSQPAIVSLEGPRSLDIDINGDGIDDFVFANYTDRGNIHSPFSYSINIRDGTESDLLHSVHIFPDGYPEVAVGSRLLHRFKSPECTSRAHFLIRDNGGRSHELLTAEKLDGKFPPGPGNVEFTFHRLRTLETVGPARYIFDGYRKVRSQEQYCDVVDAATEEVFAARSETGLPPTDDKEQPRLGPVD